MLYKFSWVIITLNALINLLLSAVAGRMFLPWWGWELIFSFYWLTQVFKSLNRAYLDTTKPRSYLWDLKPMIGWVFSIHWVSAYVLSLAILAPLGVPWWCRLLIAYPGTYLLIIAIPMQVAVIYYPKYQKKQETQRIDSTKIHASAMQCADVRLFMKRLPGARFRVADNAHKNQVAQCVFWHRKPRPEREGLYEDAVLSVPVGMKTQKPMCDRITFERYIYRETDGRSAVFHLSPDDLVDRHLDSAPLDKDALDKFDVLFDRFPSLQDAPFPLAVRDKLAEPV